MAAAIQCCVLLHLPDGRCRRHYCCCVAIPRWVIARLCVRRRRCCRVLLLVLLSPLRCKFVKYPVFAVLIYAVRGFITTLIFPVFNPTGLFACHSCVDSRMSLDLCRFHSYFLSRASCVIYITMYHAACQVELQPFNWSYLQLTSSSSSASPLHILRFGKLHGAGQCFPSTHNLHGNKIRRASRVTAVQVGGTRVDYDPF